MDLIGYSRDMARPNIGISPFASTRQGVLAVADLAADGGIDTLWLGDGLLETSDFPRWSGGMETFTELAWLAGRHPDVAVGVSAAVLPLRDVTWTARQAATLDQLTEGRVVVAVAAGFWDREFVYRGLDPADRAELFDRSLAEFQQALAGGHAEGETLSPRPFTPGGPPVWLAGARATFERALRLGLPFQAARLLPAELEGWATEWADRGGTELAVRIRVEITDAPPQGNEVDWNALVGSVEYVTDQLGRYGELGLTDISILPGQDDASSRRTVEALVGHVLPALGGARTAA